MAGTIVSLFWLPREGEVVLWNPNTRRPYSSLPHWPNANLAGREVAAGMRALEARAQQAGYRIDDTRPA